MHSYMKHCFADVTVDLANFKERVPADKFFGKRVPAVTSKSCIKVHADMNKSNIIDFFFFRGRRNLHICCGENTNLQYSDSANSG